MSKLKLLQYLEKNLVIKAKEGITLVGSKTTFYRLASSGVIRHLEPISLGLFTLPDLDENEAYFSAITKYYPESIISNETALYLYDMGEFYSGEIHVDVPIGKQINNSLIVAHRRVAKRLNSFELRTFPDKGITRKLKIYSPERCLFEAYQQGNDTDIYFRALTIYMNKYFNKESPSHQLKIIEALDAVFNTQILRDIMKEITEL